MIYRVIRSNGVIRELLGQSEKDIACGNIMSHDQVMTEIKEKHGIKID